jgi:hypothetical protein
VLADPVVITHQPVAITCTQPFCYLCCSEMLEVRNSYGNRTVFFFAIA